MNRTLVFLIFIQMTHQRLKCLRFKSAHIHTPPYSHTQNYVTRPSRMPIDAKRLYIRKKEQNHFLPENGELSIKLNQPLLWQTCKMNRFQVAHDKKSSAIPRNGPFSIAYIFHKTRKTRETIAKLFRLFVAD